MSQISFEIRFELSFNQHFRFKFLESYQIVVQNWLIWILSKRSKDIENRSEVMDVYRLYPYILTFLIKFDIFIDLLNDFFDLNFYVIYGQLSANERSLTNVERNLNFQWSQIFVCFHRQLMISRRVASLDWKTFSRFSNVTTHKEKQIF